MWPFLNERYLILYVMVKVNLGVSKVGEIELQSGSKDVLDVWNGQLSWYVGMLVRCCLGIEWHQVASGSG